MGIIDIFYMTILTHTTEVIQFMDKSHQISYPPTQIQSVFRHLFSLRF